MTIEQQNQQMLRRLLKKVEALIDDIKAGQEQMLTTSQAAKILGCTTAALRMRANRGLVNCTKSGTGRLLFKKSELIKLT